MNVRSDTADDVWDVCLKKFIRSSNLLGISKIKEYPLPIQWKKA